MAGLKASPKYHPQPQITGRTGSSCPENGASCPENGAAKFHGARIADTYQPIKVLHAVHTRVSVEAGQGQATVPPPSDSLLAYTP